MVRQWWDSDGHRVIDGDCIIGCTVETTDEGPLSKIKVLGVLGMYVDLGCPLLCCVN